MNAAGVLASGLPVSKPPLGSDFSLNGVVPVPTSCRPAAVLVPLVRREAGMTVLLTQRTEDMPSHAGQIAFPGGRTQAEDADAKATALRETEEEVGLSRTFVDVIGAVDLYRTGTGYEITPVVGIVTPGFTIHADPREVADVFEVPLAHFLDDRRTTASTAASGRAASGATTPCPTASATSGGPRRVC